MESAIEDLVEKIVQTVEWERDIVFILYQFVEYGLVECKWELFYIVHPVFQGSDRYAEEVEKDAGV